MNDDDKCFVCGKPAVFVITSQDNSPVGDPHERSSVCSKKNCILATIGFYVRLCATQPCVDFMHGEE